MPTPKLTSHPTGSHLVLLALCTVLALSRGISLVGDAQAADLASSPTHSPEQVYQMALEARTERDYPAMLRLLREAGDAGEVRAQELLASVLLVGPGLYGNAVTTDPCEASRWAHRAAMQGSEVGKHQRVLLNGMRDVTGGCAAV
ncbi:sel1 repeat family protein [Diaphorobacter sp. HDW4A]|uniref:sel1 repeat family protein n=1 Tax=Diaphorobacter sp. HDW4A TaxID=2714924 RepID=UPI00140D0650|nr:sel1 repeat family protein [Diaphorobacter sp. HDW4A]QIL82787.1 sel1 repeat family protein [Diaphorobacter sp. HDW4A]